LKYKNPDLIVYSKRMEKWLDSYIDEIKNKLKDITNEEASQIETQQAIQRIDDKKNNNDSMILAWTNKCCAVLNQKVRYKLFIDSIMNSEIDEEHQNIEDINDYFLIKGDKLLVKVPYYKYGHNIYSSSITYIVNLRKNKYKPLNFKEWLEIANKLKELKETPKPTFDINLEATLESPQDKTNKKEALKKNKQKTVLDYFGIQDNTAISDNCTLDNQENHLKDKIAKEILELNALRGEFFIHHNLNAVLTEKLYYFKDKISEKYDDICASQKNNLDNLGFYLKDLKNIENTEEKENKYIKWHQKVSSILFGIPIDKILCPKCIFFINKFANIMNKSVNVADMINATDALELDMYIADLAIFNTSGKYIINNIPILDILNKNNLDSIANIRNIVKNSYEVKIVLSKQDENQLKTINKILGEDDTHNQKYITMSQMFGHYLSHVITSNYLEVDYGYALTVHKSQGSTYDDVFIEYGNLSINKKDTEKYKLLYTAITRSANKLHIYH